jgi:hypothetical protein
VYGSVQLRDRVCRKADDALGTEDSTGCLWRQIVLADVDACGSRKPCDLGAVVHDELRTEARSHRHDGFRGLEQPAAGGVLRPELEERRAAVETGAGKIEHTPAGARCGISIDDGVQARKQRRSGLGGRD